MKEVRRIVEIEEVSRTPEVNDGVYVNEEYGNIKEIKIIIKRQYCSDVEVKFSDLIWDEKLQLWSVQL